MFAEAPFRLQSARFDLREAGAADLDDIHAVFASHPEFLALRSDIAATPPGYDRAAVRTYWEMAMLDPDRHLLVIVERGTGASVGFLDFVVQSPADGLPWIGLVMIHRTHARQGTASEAVEAVAGYLITRGHSMVRMAVIADNVDGLEFAHNLGFEDYATATTSPGKQPVVLMEMSVPSPPGGAI